MYLQAFGEEGVRLMCWAHVFRNIRPKLAAIRKANPALGESMLADIESIQWMAQSEEEFNMVCEQYKEHYLQQELTELERKLVTDFITYFLAQWGPGSHAAQWYAGAHPFSLTNNQVIFSFPFRRKFISNLIYVVEKKSYDFCPGNGRHTQGVQSEPHLSDRASPGPIHPDAGAAGKILHIIWLSSTMCHEMCPQIACYRKSIFAIGAFFGFSPVCAFKWNFK